MSTQPRPLATRRQHTNPYGDQYPDDLTTKQLICEADGLSTSVLNPDDRHVLLRWTNGTDDAGNTYVQIIQLSGGPRNYAFHTPSVRRLSSSTSQNTEYVLGEYTREQRDLIVSLAREVKFEKTSTVNNCQTWMRDLLEKMVNHGPSLLAKDKFEEIDVGVPLINKKRVLELLEDSGRASGLPTQHQRDAGRPRDEKAPFSHSTHRVDPAE